LLEAREDLSSLLPREEALEEVLGEEKGRRGRSLLILMRSAPTSPPLFWLAVGGDLLSMAPLAFTCINTWNIVAFV